MVRIVGGKYRSKKLSVPTGRQVRPTTDRVRESLFNILDHRFEYPCEDAKVLDLFAGAGTLGLEALSRGASQVTFVESDSSVLTTLSSNVAKLSGTTRVVAKPVSKFLDGPVVPVNLVFMDPPYDRGFLEPSLNSLVSRTWLLPQALVCLEYPHGVDPNLPDELDTIVSRTYGRSVVSILELK